MNRRRIIASTALSCGLALGVLAVPASASAGTNPCVSILAISQNVAPGALGGGFINIGSKPYWSGAFINNDNVSGAAIVSDVSTIQYTTSGGSHYAYVDFINPYSTYILYKGWIDVIHGC
jgi:hypothetical protein